MSIKRFLEWIGLKTQLHLGSQKMPFVREGEIWWASLGENVGFEINGKSKFFTRPVIILKRFSRGFYFVIPTTTQSHFGTWYVPFSLQNRVEIACLHQARCLDYRRLYSKLGELKPLETKKIKQAFYKLLS